MSKGGINHRGLSSVGLLICGRELCVCLWPSLAEAFLGTGILFAPSFIVDWGSRFEQLVDLACDD